MTAKGAFVAAAVAGLFASAAPLVASAKGGKVHCQGVNDCKGKGSCKSATNDCKGKNECKGKGWISLSKSECEKKGGTADEGKM